LRKFCHRHLSLFLLQSLAAVAVSGIFPLYARAANPPDVPAQITAVIQAQQEAWNCGDIDAFMNGYARASRQSGPPIGRTRPEASSDFPVFVSEDKVTRGWQTVRDRYKKKYSDRAKMGTLTFSDLEITRLSNDSAVVLGRWKLKRAKDQPHGCFTLIFRKTNDGWRIVHDHTSAASPPR